MIQQTAIKTLLICHEGALLDRKGLQRWLASFSNLAGVIVLRENRERRWRRIRREINRVGLIRFLDVLAFRLYYRLAIAVRDREWERKRLTELCAIYAEADAPILFTHSPNSAEAEDFIKRIRPDIMLARCKTLLKESVFTLPATGTFVMHPGICPEYRNAHGCFWALANGDLDKVGMTLLRIDKGVDTGPVYGYFSYDYDESTESHIVISQRALFDNLEAVAKRLIEIHEGSAPSVDTSGRRSAAWGQPWLTAYLKWKRKRTFRVSRSAFRVPEFEFRVSRSAFRVPDPHEVPATNNVLRTLPNAERGTRNAERGTRNAERVFGETK